MTRPEAASAGSDPHGARPDVPAARELARITRAYRTLSAGNRTLLRAVEEADLLHEMCRVIVEQGGYRLACVGYAEHDDQKSIRYVTYPPVLAPTEAVPTTPTEPVHDTWADTELGRHSAAGTAIRAGKPTVGRNLLTDPDLARWRDEAIRFGYAAVSCFPLWVEGEVIGALCMTALEPDAFDDEEVRLLSELAEDLAYGIANLRSRVKRREAEATIARLAYYDTLTGLPNRTLLRQLVAEAIQSAKHHHHSLALLHLEVGRFREINEILGYQQGDQLLRELCRRLDQAVGGNAVLARVGDSELGLLLRRGSADYATQVAEHILATLREPIDVAGVRVDSQARIGIALFPGHGTDPDVLIRRANVAMHQARETSGGCVIYSGGLGEERTRRLALMGDLSQAIQRNELMLYCQPKVNMTTRKLCGAEALLRWQQPQRGMVSTGEFIKLAEQTGSITPITDWVLEAAFSQAYAWHAAGLDQSLAINLSALDLRNPRLFDRIQGLFTTWGVLPEWIQFELTESALMQDPAGGLETLMRLKTLDVELLIDDFGTGYSSLSYLQKLPVDAIKIDQSFIAPMVGNDDSAVIVRSTIEMGHNLNLRVIAEGVDSEAVWQRLAGLGCDMAQGYLISQPIPADRLPDWEREWSRMAR